MHNTRILVTRSEMGNEDKKVRVGIIGGMGDILEAQMKAEKVIRK